MPPSVANKVVEHDLEPRKLEYSPPREKRKAVEPQESSSLPMMAFCFVSLQASYLTWGYLQEKVMTTEYETGRFPSATFCVFSNRVLAIVVAAAAMVLQHGRVHVPAPLFSFAPCSLSNSLSSYGQYQALRYVSFPLQTLSKSTKIIPVMLMGRLLNRKTYPWIEYFEAVCAAPRGAGARWCRRFWPSRRHPTPSRCSSRSASRSSRCPKRSARATAAPSCWAC